MRRWCIGSECGNRMKVAKFYAQSRKRRLKDRGSSKSAAGQSYPSALSRWQKARPMPEDAPVASANRVRLRLLRFGVLAA
jgi:hypothetical protein